MRRIVHIMFTISLMCLFVGCEKEPLEEGQMVMEASISDNEPPVVMLHKSVVMSANKYRIDEIQDMLKEHIIHWGKVVVSDGEQQYVLTGRIDTAYFPPYIYTTNKFVGQAGKHYTIEASYKGEAVRAETDLMPQKPLVDKIQVQQYADGEVSIHIYIIDKGAIGENKYAVFTRRFHEKQYLICMTGTVVKQLDHDTIVLPVNRPVYDMTTEHDIALRYKTGDTINIRLATLTNEAYQYWETYTSQAFSSGYFFTPIYSNYPSNTSNGLGYFFGYNCFNFTLDLNKDSIYYIR